MSRLYEPYQVVGRELFSADIGVPVSGKKADTAKG